MSGAVGALVACDKGHNRLSWVVIGLLLGPFALLFALVARTKGGSVEQRAAASGLLAPCPVCRREVWAMAPKCPHCAQPIARTARRGG